MKFVDTVEWSPSYEVQFLHRGLQLIGPYAAKCATGFALRKLNGWIYTIHATLDHESPSYVQEDEDALADVRSVKI